jgi:hypothetical protein
MVLEVEPKRLSSLLCFNFIDIPEQLPLMPTTWLLAVLGSSALEKCQVAGTGDKLASRTPRFLA